MIRRAINMEWYTTNFYAISMCECIYLDDLFSISKEKHKKAENEGTPHDVRI